MMFYSLMKLNWWEIDMADRTHFYPVHKGCDLECQRYDKVADALFFCEHFHITDLLPTGDGPIVPHVNGFCKLKQQEENK